MRNVTAMLAKVSRATLHVISYADDLKMVGMQHFTHGREQDPFHP